MIRRPNVLRVKGCLTSPKRMNFRKSSKRPLIPPPHYRKVILQMFSEIHDWSIVFEDISGHFEILMSQLGQVKKTLPFRAMSKQCEFFTLQGVGNQVTHQTHPSTADNDRHHPNTYYTSSRHHSDMSIHLLTSTETNWHKQTPTDTPRHLQTLSGVVWCWLKVTFWRLLVSVGMCWRLLLSGDI